MTISLASLPQPRSCFYCIDLRLATIIIGISEVLYGLVELNCEFFGYRIYGLYFLSELVNENRYYYHGLKSFWVFSLVTTCGSGVMLLFGVAKKKKFLIELFVVFHLLVNFFSIILIKVLMVLEVVNNVKNFSMLLGIVFIIVFCFDTYFTIVVNSYLQEFFNQRRDANVRMHANQTLAAVYTQTNSHLVDYRM